MYAAPRVDIPELLVVRKQFTAKYGKKFDEQAMGNVGGILNERVVTKLSVQPPAAYLVQTYLEQICEKYEVDWSPNYRLSAEQMGEPMAPPSGFSVPIGTGTGLGHVAHTGMTVSGEDDVTYNEGLYLPPPQAPTNGSNSSASAAKTDNSDFYIPTAPGASNPPPIVPPPVVRGPEPMVPPPVVRGPDSTNDDINKGDDDDESNNNQSHIDSPGQPSSSSGKDSASYNDLAARFESLKNL
jgi:hypothetical protein